MTPHTPHVLVVGASLLQVPMIRRARELGFEVSVIDQDPEAPGVALADHFGEVSTIDVDGMVAYARAAGVDGIATIGTDFPMRAISRAAEALGTASIAPAVADRCTDKGASAAALAQAGVPRPDFVVIEAGSAVPDLRSLPLPCIVKPVDSSGSRGVTSVSDRAGLAAAIDRARGAARSGNVIVEELMEGPEVSVEVFLHPGHEPFATVTDKTTSGAPHFVETGHTEPTFLDDAVRERTIAVALDAMRALGIEAGPAHVEIMVTADGPKIVEVGARLGGDFITSHLVPLATGFDIVGAVLSWAMGVNPPSPVDVGHAAANRYFPPTVQSVPDDAVEAMRNVPGIVEVFVNGGATGGDSVQSSSERLGNVISQAPTREAAVEACDAALALIIAPDFKETAE